jgi:hypothetical protein
MIPQGVFDGKRQVKFVEFLKMKIQVVLADHGSFYLIVVSATHKIGVIHRGKNFYQRKTVLERFFHFQRSVKLFFNFSVLGLGEAYFKKGVTEKRVFRSVRGVIHPLFDAQYV